MKFTCHVEINKARNDVIALWENEKNLIHWQDGYISSELISGEKAKVGSKTRMYYQIGKRKIELLETILNNSLPEKFIGLYETQQMSNTMKNTFTIIEDEKTLWTSEIEYTKMNGFLVKVMALIAPSMFRKQTQKWLDQFKGFAEQQ